MFTGQPPNSVFEEHFSKGVPFVHQLRVRGDEDTENDDDMKVLNSNDFSFSKIQELLKEKETPIFYNLKSKIHWDMDWKGFTEVFESNDDHDENRAVKLKDYPTDADSTKSPIGGVRLFGFDRLFVGQACCASACRRFVGGGGGGGLLFLALLGHLLSFDLLYRSLLVHLGLGPDYVGDHSVVKLCRLFARHAEFDRRVR